MIGGIKGVYSLRRSPTRSIEGLSDFVIEELAQWHPRVSRHIIGLVQQFMREYELPEDRALITAYTFCVLTSEYVH